MPHLLVEHIVDALAHGAVAGLAFLGLGQPRGLLLGTQSLLLDDLVLVNIEVGLDVFRNFGQTHQLLFNLGVKLVHLINFHIDLVDDHLVPERRAGVSPLFN